MEGTQDLPLEIRLSAYLDGQLPEAEMDEIDGILAENGEARAVFEKLKRGSELGARAFDKLLQEPVPPALLHGIRQAARPAAAAPVKNPRRRPASYWTRTVAASLALFALGGTLGYLAGERQDTGAPLKLAAARTWLDDVADYHRIHARQTRHLVEVPASESGHIVEWLSASTGVAFRLPDLSGEKLAFAGARLLVAGGRPAGQLVYRDADGEVFAICFLQSDGTGGDTGLTETMRNDIGLVSWQKGSTAYVVVGPSADPGLERLAERVWSEI